jgi:purine-binding chemotaxis protein CheW
MSDTQDNKIEYSVFSISDNLFGLEISSVKEVLKFPKITRLPNTQKPVLGIYNLRGDIISLFDMQQILGLGARQSYEGDMVLVIAENGRRFSFVVDRVMDFIRFDKSLIQMPENESDIGEGSFISGLYKHESFGQIRLLDSTALLEVDRFVEMSG